MKTLLTITAAKCPLRPTADLGTLVQKNKASKITVDPKKRTDKIRVSPVPQKDLF